VIVITGPGRSGTSFLAMLYRELGFDPGGHWNDRFNAGFEAHPFPRTNTELTRALGTVATPGFGSNSRRVVDLLCKWSTRRLPESTSKRVNPALLRLKYRRNTLDLVDWSKVDPLVAEVGERLRKLSTEREVVKDPRFCWTLHVWLRSGASISSVVLALRPLDSMVDSRARAGMIPKEAGNWAKNNFAYGIGLLMAAAAEHRVPVQIVRFPDFLDDPRDLYERLPLPAERTWEEFRAAFEKVHGPALVHDRR
jgi:hypothetical protein